MKSTAALVAELEEKGTFLPGLKPLIAEVKERLLLLEERQKELIWFAEQSFFPEDGHPGGNVLSDYGHSWMCKLFEELVAEGLLLSLGDNDAAPGQHLFTIAKGARVSHEEKG